MTMFLRMPDETATFMIDNNKITSEKDGTVDLVIYDDTTHVTKSLL